MRLSMGGLAMLLATMSYGAEAQRVDDAVDISFAQGTDEAVGIDRAGPVEPDADSQRELVAEPDPSPQSVPPPQLAEPTRDPLRIVLTDDPIIELINKISSPQAFTRLVEQSVIVHPSVDEATAGEDEAYAARREARSALFPTLDLGFSTRESFARNFSNDPDNVVEQARSRGRTDATFTLQQRILDFGAASIRVDAAGARLRAAGYEIDRQADQIALRAIAAWYDVFTFRALVQLGEEFARNQMSLRESILVRIDRGVSAQGDLAQIDSTIANSETQQAGFRRSLANAEARFEEIFDTPPPPGLARAPLLGGNFASRDAARAAALMNPVVALVEAQSRAALQDARAARAETLPTVNASIEGGRFGVFETDNDYDIRGSLTLQHRFFGAGDARADGAEARADGAEARVQRVREEAVRLAAIAWTDIQALEEQLDAVEEAYITGRQSRDVLLERFRVARGTLFDVLSAENSYFSAAASYIQTITELDAAHYVLLSRTGRLLGVLGIDTALLRGNQ